MTSSTGLPPSKPPSEARKLLVVDDDRPLLRTLAIVFSRRGWDVTTMPDGLRALAELRLRCFDAIVVDERMGGPAGGFLAETIAVMCPHSRLVLYSGWPSAWAHERVTELGGVVLMKGATHDELVDAVEGRPRGPEAPQQD